MRPRRRPGEGESLSFLDRIHRVRVGPAALVVLFLVLAGVYLALSRTDLWYVLFP